MSVEQRLRDGFGDAVAAYLPDVEPRLAAVRERRQRRRAGLMAGGAAGLAAVGVATVVLLTGPRAEEPAPLRPDDPAVTTSATSASGTWTRTVTTEDAQKLGVSQSFIDREIGADGRLPVTLMIGLSRYSQEGSHPDGPAVGDAGPVFYDDGGRLVMVSESRGAGGWTVRLSWEITGDTLVLERAGGAVLTPAERLMILGTWTAQ